MILFYAIVFLGGAVLGGIVSQLTDSAVETILLALPLSTLWVVICWLGWTAAQGGL